jgi:hypothetical protein
MNALISLYDALVSIDVPAEKARAVVDAMERDMAAILATKADIELLRRDVEGVRLAAKSDIELLRRDLEGVRTAAKTDAEMLRASAKSDAEMLRASMTIRLGSMLVVAIGVLFAALTLTLRWVIR